MTSEAVEEAKANPSSVVSSEASSKHSLCCGEDGEGVFNTTSSGLSARRQKSSSLSCLPDRIFILDENCSTLPSKLSSVKPFEEDLRQGVSTVTCYDTAESLSSTSAESLHDDANIGKLDKILPDNHPGENEGSLQENTNTSGQQQEVNGFEEELERKKDVDLSELNTETRTFVRSSALDILAAFPKTETVVEGNSVRSRSPENTVHHTGSLSVLSEDPSEQADNSPAVSRTEHAQPNLAKSEPVLAGSQSAACDEQPEGTTWGSTSEVDPKVKKKRLFQKGKKKKTVISKNLNVQDSVDGKRSSSDDSENKQNSGAASQRRPRGKKAKKKSSSSGWMDFFRGKSESREESAKREKPRKARKPVQKSQSFHSGTTSSSRNAQLNRMDSFRKLFKRPRDSIAGSTVLGEGKNTENIKCLEISSPILKSEFRSNKLVDRDVFIAQRDRAYQLDKEKLKKDKKQGEDPQLGVVDRLPRTPNGIVEEERTKIALNRCDDSRLMPVAPVRWKHLERKRQSLAEEGNGEAIEATSCVQNGDDSEPHGGNLDDLVLNESTAHNEDIKQTNSGVNAVVPKPLSSPDQEVRKPTEEKALDNNGNETHPFNRLTPHDSSITHDLSFPGKPCVDESSLVQSPPGFDIGGCEEEFEDVFQECSDDQKLFFDSSAGTAQVERMPVESTNVKRWHSDVTSDASKKAIGVVKKSATFCEGNSSGSTSEMSSAGTSSNEDRPQRRSLSIFTRIPTVKLEQPDQPTMVTDLVPTSFPLFLTDRRSQIVLELFTTERTYVRGLETMIELFKKPLLSGRVDEKEVDALFSNINEIFAVNKDLLFLLWEKVKHWSSEQCIGHLFTDMEDRFKIYAIYCKNFDRADAMYKQKIKRNKDFDRFLKACYQDPLCQPGLDLPAYLITVVQRIPRYLLLLKDLCKKTPASHPDYDNLKQALSRMNKVAEYINSQLQEVHGQKAMQELRSTVIGLKAYEVKGRTLLKEAEVCLMSPKKPYKCLLFNDIMVFAVQGSKDRSEIEMTLELRTLWFEDLRNQDPQTNKCDAIELYTPRRPYTMYACSRTEKRVWLQKLRTAIVTLLYGPDCEDPDGMDISRRKASDTYIDGSVYCGEYLNGKRHGEGVMAWPNRTRYEGSWADDERHGHGQLTYYTKEKYVGSWVADKKDGRGRQTYVNGDVYDGEWSEGKMHGKGVIEFGNGDRFVGDMLNNEVEGHGEMTCVSGMLYKGEWKTSKRHGQGHVFFPNGNEYKGEFLNDRICGYGQMNYFNGDAYVGEWVNEMRHGIGYFKLVQGDVYDGQWNNDFMNGQGKMSYSNGDEYTGTWYQNKRFGKGQMIFAYGDTYNGQWQDDTMHGKGVMYYKDGSVYDGFWERGERHGHGKTVYCDNSVYEGEYFNGFRQGRGKLIFANNVCYVGEWKADKFDGNGVFSDPNTEYSYQGDWSCGKREGTGIEISYRTRYEGGWKADMKHGTGIEKSHAGHTFEGTWKENKKHGRGVRTLRSNVREEQNWYEGHLADMAETVAEDLPPLPRR